MNPDTSRAPEAQSRSGAGVVEEDGQAVSERVGGGLEACDEEDDEVG